MFTYQVLKQTCLKSPWWKVWRATLKDSRHSEPLAKVSTNTHANNFRHLWVLWCYAPWRPLSCVAVGLYALLEMSPSLTQSPECDGHSTCWDSKYTLQHSLGKISGHSLASALGCGFEGFQQHSKGQCTRYKGTSGSHTPNSGQLESVAP